MEEADIYFVDTRNADPRDHRAQGSAATVRGPSGRPMTTVAVPGSGGRVFAATPQPAYPVPYGNPYTNPYANPFANPYGNPFLNPQQPTLATSILGRVSTGQMIDLVAQIFAALMPLPGAPTATSDASVDVGNLIMYQGALAQYAKRDEQVRTLGNLVTKLVG